MKAGAHLQTNDVVHDGVRLTVAEAGQGDPALLFLHPTAADHTFFGPQVEEFSARHRVIAIDQRGYGSSDRPNGPYTPEAFADDAGFVLEALGLERVVVLGSSMGGAVAMELAARHPDRIRGLVLMNRSVLNNPAAAAVIGGLVADLRGADLERALNILVDSQIGAIDPPELHTTYREMVRGTPPEVLAATLEGFTDWDGEAALAKVGVPVLFTFSHVPGSYATLDRLSALSPHVLFGHTVGAGHFDHITVPEQLNPLIRGFLDRCID